MSGDAWKFKKTRGCNSYTSNGILAFSTEPCPRGAGCWYVHPEDPEWPNLKWKRGVGRLEGTAHCQSRSRSRGGQRSRSREGRFRSPGSRERDSGWGRKRAEREWEKKREQGDSDDHFGDHAAERSQPRDGSVLDRDRDWGQPTGFSSSRNTRRRLSSPPQRRDSYHDNRRDRSSPRPSSPFSRRRRDSVTSVGRGGPSSPGRPRTPRSNRRNSSALDTLLYRPPEDRKPDIRDLERARLQEIAWKRRKENFPQDAVETIDLTRTPIVGTPTQMASPPLSGQTETSMAMSTPPPPPAEIPPPVPVESPVFKLTAMTDIHPSPIQSAPILPQAPDMHEHTAQEEEALGGGWDERIQALTQLVELQASISVFKEEIERTRRLGASTMLPDAAREDVEKRLKKSEDELDAKVAEFERLRDENVRESNVLPISHEQMERDVALLGAYQEMIQYLAKLVRVTSQVQKEVEVLGDTSMPIAEGLTGDVKAQMRLDEESEMVGEARQETAALRLSPSRERGEGSMDVDGATPTSPAVPSSFSSSSISPLLSDSSSPPQRTMTRRDFNEISARLDALEKEINSIDDAVLQRENELRDEFENELRSREEELMEHVDRETRVGREGRGSDGEGSEGELFVGEDQRNNVFEDEGLADIQKQSEDLKAQTEAKLAEVEEMNEIIKNFQTRLVFVENERPDAESEYQAALQRSADIRTRLAAIEEADRFSSMKVETLQTTLDMCMTSTGPPSPPSSPAPPAMPPSFLLHTLREPLKAEARKALIPLVEDCRAGVDQKMKAEVAEVYGTVWERAQGAVRVATAVEMVLAKGGVIINGVDGKEGAVTNGATSH